MSTTIPTREVEVWRDKVVVVQDGVEIGLFPVTKSIGADGALRNAEMFKASEDMLAALDNMLGAFDNAVRRMKMPGNFNDEAVASARAAIARARGETP